MQPDPKIKEIKTWLKKAKQDIDAALNDLLPEMPFTGSAVFHCQQAVEKVLKGFLTWQDQPFRKTHEIRELSKPILDRFSDLESLMESASSLSPYATVFRYPGDAIEPTLEEAREAIRIATEVYKAITARLPPNFFA